MCDVRFGSLAGIAAIPTDVRLPPKAYIHCDGRNVRFLPKPDIGRLVCRESRIVRVEFATYILTNKGTEVFDLNHLHRARRTRSTHKPDMPRGLESGHKPPSGLLLIATASNPAA
jgi:hypothetical protein